MLELVDSDLYFVQDKNYFINSLLQVGSGSAEKVPDPDPAGQKSTDPYPQTNAKKDNRRLYFYLRTQLLG